MQHVLLLTQHKRTPPWIAHLKQRMNQVPDVTAHIQFSSPLKTDNNSQLIHRWKQIEDRLFRVTALDTSNATASEMSPPGIAFNIIIDCDSNSDTLNSLDEEILSDSQLWSVIISKSNISAFAAVAQRYTSNNTFTVKLVTKTRSKELLSTSTCAIERISINRSLNQAYWHAGGLILSQIENNKAGQTRPKTGSVTTLPRHSGVEFEKDQNQDKTKVSQIGLIRGIASRYAQYLKIKTKELKRSECWEVLLSPYNPHQDPLTIPKPCSFSEQSSFQKLKAKPGYFQADPFVIDLGSVSYIFMEEGKRSDKIGYIAVQKMDHKGPIGESIKVLESNHHLSYPFVFQHQGYWYMIPEQAESGKVTLYQSTNFPYEWKPHVDLIKEIKLYDPTILRHQNRWWLFGTKSHHTDMNGNSELHLFSSDQLTAKDWEPHPWNPVVNNCLTARPAGNIRTIGQRLIRPAQICAPHYGYGISFQEIQKLSRTEYKETTIKQWLPSVKHQQLGIHTFNQHGKWAVSDQLCLKRKQH